MRRIAIVLVLATLAFTAAWNTSCVVAQGESGGGSLLSRLHDRLMGRTASPHADPSASGHNTPHATHTPHGTHTSRPAPHSPPGAGRSSTGSSNDSAADSWAREPSTLAPSAGVNTQANGRSGGMSIKAASPMPGATTSSSPNGRTAVRMHERLNAFQQSAFPSRPNTAGANRSASLPRTNSTTAQERGQSLPAPAAPLNVGQASPAPPAPQGPTMAPPNMPAPMRLGTSVEAPPAHSGLPAIETPTSSNQRPAFADRSLMSRTISSRPNEPPPADNGPTLPTPARVDLGSSDRVLFTQVSPALAVETVGPRQIAIGKEATFEVSIRNEGKVAAEETWVIVTLPPSADFMRADTSVGSARSEAVNPEGKQVRWTIGRIAPGREEKLTLVIIPRENRSFDLAVRWDHRPVGSQAMIEVQEAKLAMRLDGPADVLFGKEEIYRLELSNTGNGAAREIVISLTPVGAGEHASVNHTIHELAPGETKVIQVELTARQTGTLTIAVDATGDGVHAHLEERITVRRAALAVEVDAPPVQFVGTQATHQIRVRNTGTAAAEQVQVAALIPPGISYVSSSEGCVVNDDRDRVVWLLTELAPGAEREFKVVCEMRRPGRSRLEVVCSARGDLTASDVAVVQVEAMADLTMEVHDPSGPVATGADAVYTIRIENRGTELAQSIDLKAFFSPGIEPVNVEGGIHRIDTGLVTFERIPSLAAGQSMFFEITARAQTPGNHVFRAELTCTPIEAHLVSQETTHFYGNSTTTTPGASVASETEEPSRLVEEEVRTARRPVPAGPSPIGPSPYFDSSGALSRPSPSDGSNPAAAESTGSSESGGAVGRSSR